MGKLSVNVDHIATLREARGGSEPDPLAAVFLAELGGATGITIHLREDRRHIQERDVEIIKTVAKAKLNLEMGLADEIVKIALRIRPDMVTLVPEKDEELTTQGGLDLSRDNPRLKEVISLLHQAQIPVSLFVNPDPNSVKRAQRLGADTLELHTGIYAEMRDPLDAATEVERVAGAAALAKKLTLGVNAGHGLDYHNVREISLIEDIEEFSIGHSIISRACFVGLKEAVREMVALLGG